MHLGTYLGLIHEAERDLAEAFRRVANDHRADPDVADICGLLASQCDDHAERIQPFRDDYGMGASNDEPNRLRNDLFRGTRDGALGLLRDLHDLYIMASEVDISWTIVAMAAQGVQDKKLFAAVQACEGEIAIHLKWLRTRMKREAPQALIAA